MAVGVPETDVFAAADAVLARGERPTVERVRLELGRGSPARVGALLDQWWEQLAGRLRGEARLPGLPSEVAQAFVAVWQQATQLALGVAEQTLAEQRQVLASEREQLAVLEDQARQDIARYRQQTAEAVAGHQAVETRLADLELLLDQRLAQIEDLKHRREELVRERGEAQQHVQGLQQQLQDLMLKFEQGRAAQETYVRGVEERAYREIDRAREESKSRAAQLKEVSRQLGDLQRRLESACTGLSEAQQQAVAQQARADTLAQQLLQLPAVPAEKPKVRKRTTSASKRQT
ncbi:DNA-binding protein [Pseudomonas sp. PCH446]